MSLYRASLKPDSNLSTSASLSLSISLSLLRISGSLKDTSHPFLQPTQHLLQVLPKVSPFLLTPHRARPEPLTDERRSQVLESSERRGRGGRGGEGGCCYQTVFRGDGCFLRHRRKQGDKSKLGERRMKREREERTGRTRVPKENSFSNSTENSGV